MGGPVSPTACPSWAAKLKRRELPVNLSQLPMKTPHADRVARIFNRLRVPDLPGQPRVSELENSAWVEKLGRALFGGSDINELMLLVSKKQSKTSHGALLYLAAMLADQAPRQNYTILAPTTGIAGFSFDQIRGAIEADPKLLAKCAIRRHTKEIEFLKTNNTIQVKSASLQALTGLKGSVFVDELHVWGSMKDGQKLRQQLKGALAASKTARGLYITTQSDSPPQGVFDTMLKYARMIRDGDLVDQSFLPVLFEPWEGCDPWNDPSVWPCLMPSYPHIADADFYRSVISEANQAGGVAMAEAKSQYFNIQIGTGQGGKGWEVAESYMGCTEKFSLSDLMEDCSQIAIGIDLGGSGDMSSIVVLGIEGQEWMVWQRSWLTQAGFDTQSNAAKAFLPSCIEAGDLVICAPGDDVNDIVELCIEARETGKLTGVGADPAGAADLADALEAAGFIMDKDLHGVGQSAFRLAPAVRTLERRVDKGAVTFCDQPIMGWALGNCMKRQSGNAPQISKEYAVDRMDPVAALLDAVIVSIHHRAAPFDVGAFVAA